jgi:nickel/cobalt transporter (NiCoT) family protein
MASLVAPDPTPQEEEIPNNTPSRELSMKKRFLRKATENHGKLPGVRRIPLPAIGIIGLIAVVNMIVWVVAGIVLV